MYLVEQKKSPRPAVREIHFLGKTQKIPARDGKAAVLLGFIPNGVINVVKCDLWIFIKC